ncbi:hypothetical protein V474_06840 [Novosphingobium barchaimii LL02]|uniref:Uncharacterized protein n=1 Tax=Novosphingobium barchaimii LL02 TaxID=1114963 RepID=A0A0J7XFK7_9SPHN|nr:hypothetical protein V474_06840 [Novosphingobium barchaimii LL02]
MMRPGVLDEHVPGKAAMIGDVLRILKMQFDCGGLA